MTFKTFDGENCALCERVSNRYTKEVRLINQKTAHIYTHEPRALSVFEKY